MKRGKLGTVFYVSVAVISIFVLWGFISPDHLGQTADNALDFTIQTFGWFYLFATFLFLVFSLYMAFGAYGNIKLGSDDDQPEYSYLTWFSMLFSAGMGIGLVFWGTAEPISHFNNPPFDVSSKSEAAKVAMRYSFFHWGLHPWAIYSILGLSLAYFQFRKSEPGLISSTLKPLFGEKMSGRYGTAVNVIAVFATVFGVATSLGLGAQQISSGLSF